MIDLESKQKVWANQLPLFKENYILTSDLDLLEFDMINGKFDIKPNQGNDGFDDEDSLVLYHSVNTAWAMWLRCNRLNQAEIEALKAQLAKVESSEFVVVPKIELMTVIGNCSDAMTDETTSSVYDKTGEPSTWYDHHIIAENKILAMIEAAQENSHDNSN